MGVDPTAVALDTRHHRLVVASGGPVDDHGVHVGHGDVTVIDTRSGARLASGPVGMSPTAAAADEGLGVLVVVSGGVPPAAGSATLIDARTGRIMATLRLRGVPRIGCAIDGVRHRAYVANLVSDSVSVIDLRARKVVKARSLGSPPGTAARISVDARTQRVYVLSFPPRRAGESGTGAGEIAVLTEPALRVVTRVSLPNPQTLALDARSGVVAVSSGRRGLSRLTGIDGRTGIVRWSARLASPVAPAVGGGKIIVYTPARGGLTVLSAQLGRQICRAPLGLPVGAHPVLASDDSGARVFLARSRQGVAVRRLPC